MGNFVVSFLLPFLSWECKKFNKAGARDQHVVLGRWLYRSVTKCHELKVRADGKTAILRGRRVGGKKNQEIADEGDGESGVAGTEVKPKAKP